MGSHTTAPPLDLAPPRPWRRFIPSWLRSLIWVDSARNYDAFLSYSWKSDSKVAPVLQSVLQRFLCPWYKLRAKTIFRDLSCLPAGSSLESELFDRLDRSNHLIVLASPEAAASHGMEMEARHWFSRPRDGHVLIIVSSGNFKVWEGIRDNLLPPTVRNNLASEPLWIDVQGRRNNILNNPNSHRLREELIEDLKQVLLRLYPNCDWGQLRGEERAQRRRALGLLFGLLGLLLVLAVTALWQRSLAIEQRNEANRRRLVSVAQALSAYAPREQGKGGNDELAALLARQAFILNMRARGERLDQVDSALRQTLGTRHFSISLDTGQDTSKLTAIALSGDGQVMAVGGGSKALLWNLRKPSEPAQIFSHRYGYILALAFAPNSDKLYAATQDGYVIAWTVGNSAETPGVYALTGTGSKLFSTAAVSANGKRVAYGSEDGRVTVWDFVTPGAAPITLCCHDRESMILAVAFHPRRENIVASGGSDNAVRIWDIDHPEIPIKVLPGHDNAVKSIQFSPEGRTIVSGTVRAPVWQAGNAQNWLGENKMQGGTVYLWDLRGGEPRRFSGQGGSVTALAFRPQGDFIASAGGGDETVRLWNLAERQPFPFILVGHKGNVAALAFAGEGKTLTSVSDSSVRLWDMEQAGGAPIVLSGQGGEIRSLGFGKSNDVLLSGGGDEGEVRLWDIGKRSHVLLEQEGFAVSVAYSPQGNLIAASSEGGALKAGNSILLWNPESLDKPVVLDKFQSRVEALSFSGDGKLLASAGKLDKQVLVWDVSDLTTPKFISTGPGSILFVAVSRQGQNLAWGGSDNQVRLKDLTQPNKEAVILRAHNSHVTSVTFGPEEWTLASGDEDGTVRLWDVRQSKVVAVYSTGTKESISCVAIDSSGRFLAAGGTDGRIRVWDMTNPSSDPLVFEGPGKKVYSIAFSPDGLRLAGGGSANGIFVWPSTNALQELVCQKVRRNLSHLEWKQFVGADIPYECTCGNLPCERETHK